jgi:C4-dicarboxylate-specific signal transduction histidine kinase
LERIERNTERLANIVERTRERISHQRRKPEPLQLLDVAEEVRVLLEHDFAARSTALCITCDHGLPPVSADKVELQQVFVNLLVNALDAMAATMEEKRRVEVWIGLAAPGWVQVSVGDTGPGISDENMTKLFQPFFTTKSGGIGMGLQICRASIEALGGELKARNRPEGGAVFEFALPAA